jgi:hypothetical protein
VLTYHGARDAENFRHLLHQLEKGRVGRVAFVRPAGASWLLALYELALTTAVARDARRAPVELTFVTPETEPCEVFGASSSAVVSTALDSRNPRVHKLRGCTEPPRPALSLTWRPAGFRRPRRDPPAPGGT